MKTTHHPSETFGFCVPRFPTTTTTAFRSHRLNSNNYLIQLVGICYRKINKFCWLSFSSYRVSDVAVKTFSGTDGWFLIFFPLLHILLTLDLTCSLWIMIQASLKHRVVRGGGCHAEWVVLIPVKILSVIWYNLAKHVILKRTVCEESVELYGRSELLRLRSVAAFAPYHQRNHFTQQSEDFLIPLIWDHSMCPKTLFFNFGMGPPMELREPQWWGHSNLWEWTRLKTTGPEHRWGKGEASGVPLQVPRDAVSVLLRFLAIVLK